MSHPDIRQLKKRCEEVSGILSSVSHPTRILILCSLSEKEMTVSELIEEVGVSQSLMSQFLGRMKQEGLLSSSRQGKTMIYKISDQRIYRLLKSLRDIFCKT